MRSCDPASSTPFRTRSANRPVRDRCFTRGEDTIARVLSKLFSFLFQRSTKEERVAQYAIREHHRGRPLREILEDHYVVNRLTTPEQRARLLDRPEILHAFGEDIVAAARTDQTS